MTLDLKALQDQLKTCLGEMETSFAAIGAAKDAETKKAAETLYQGKSQEFDKLKAQVDEAKKHAARFAVLDDVNELTKTDMRGKSLAFRTNDAGNSGGSGNRVNATARDHNQEERELVEMFSLYFRGKSIGAFSDNARAALAPKGKWKLENDTPIEAAVAIPMSIVAQVFPEALIGGKSQYSEFLSGSSRSKYYGKALPMTSAGAGNEANLFQPDFMKNLLQFPSEPPRFWPLAYKVPCQYGKILWPQLDQGTAAPGTGDSDTDATEFLEEGGAVAYWTAEGAEINGTEPKFKQQSIETFELGVRTELSRQLISRSTIPIEATIDNIFRRAVMNRLDRALIAGNGVTRPTGVLGFGNVVARNTPLHVNYEDFVNLEHAIAPQLRPGAVYGIQDKALQDIKLKKDSQGRPLFIPLTSAASDGTQLGTINGYPVVPSERMPALGVEGDLIFGNWGQYIAPVEQEIIMARSAERKIEQNVIVYVMFIQAGGKPVTERAFATLNT